jgi:multicomponent K+:H+ antiporter subunit A
MVLALLPEALDRHARVIGMAGALLGAAAVTLFLVATGVSRGPEKLFRFAWIKGLGLEFVLMRDGLSVMFVALVSWIALIVTVYAWGYLPYANKHERSDRRESAFYAAMALFTGSMVGVVTSGNLLQMYFFWELTGIASYLLIGYWSHLEEARKGAFLAMGQTVAGGVLMLAGFFLLGNVTGAWNFPELLHPKHEFGPWLPLCTVLIVAGALAKSAQFPFMSWLPGAMIAPTPVSAFLHSSALVALGVYCAARFYPLLCGTPAWWYSLSVPAAIGAVSAGFLAFRQEKMKAVLAYSTISQYAFMFIGFSTGTIKGVEAAIYTFFVHAFIKAGLFLLTGSVTHVTGERELSNVGGLLRSHPFLAICAAILGLSLAGLPAMAGFYYKEELLKAMMDGRFLVLYAVLLAGSFLSLLYILRFLYEIFIFDPPRSFTAEPLPFTMGLGLALPYMHRSGDKAFFRTGWLCPSQ